MADVERRGGDSEPINPDEIFTAVLDDTTTLIGKKIDRRVIESWKRSQPDASPKLDPKQAVYFYALPSDIPHEPPSLALFYRSSANFMGVNFSLQEGAPLRQPQGGLTISELGIINDLANNKKSTVTVTQIEQVLNQKIPKSP